MSERLGFSGILIFLPQSSSCPFTTLQSHETLNPHLPLLDKEIQWKKRMTCKRSSQQHYTDSSFTCRVWHLPVRSPQRKSYCHDADVVRPAVSSYVWTQRTWKMLVLHQVWPRCTSWIFNCTFAGLSPPFCLCCNFSTLNVLYWLLQRLVCRIRKRQVLG